MAGEALQARYQTTGDGVGRIELGAAVEDSTPSTDSEPTFDIPDIALPETTRATEGTIADRFAIYCAEAQLDLQAITATNHEAAAHTIHNFLLQDGEQHLASTQSDEVTELLLPKTRVNYKLRQFYDTYGTEQSDRVKTELRNKFMSGFIAVAIEHQKKFPEIRSSRQLYSYCADNALKGAAAVVRELQTAYGMTINELIAMRQQHLDEKLRRQLARDEFSRRITDKL